MSSFTLDDGAAHFKKGGRNSNHILKREQAKANWLVKVKIGKKTRTLTDWLGKISDKHLAKFCSYSVTTINRKRNELGIPYFQGYVREITVEIATVRCQRNTKLLMSFGGGKPMSVEMKEFLLKKDMAALEIKYE